MGDMPWLEPEKVASVLSNLVKKYEGEKFDFEGKQKPRYKLYVGDDENGKEIFLPLDKLYGKNVKFLYELFNDIAFSIYNKKTDESITIMDEKTKKTFESPIYREKTIKEEKK